MKFVIHCHSERRLALLGFSPITVFTRFHPFIGWRGCISRDYPLITDFGSWYAFVIDEPQNSGAIFAVFVSPLGNGKIFDILHN